jgi:hypothetical protein
MLGPPLINASISDDEKPLVAAGADHGLPVARESPRIYRRSILSMTKGTAPTHDLRFRRLRENLDVVLVQPV